MPRPGIVEPRRNNDVAGGYHEPVLVTEVLEALAPVPHETIVDGTLGGGGHTRALLGTGAKIIGLDQDIAAIGYCLPQDVVYDRGTVILVEANFRNLNRVLNLLEIEMVNGFLFDLGVSSAQLDQAERGFSFMKSGPLDMRMNQSGPVSAADLVNFASHDTLKHLFRVYGEEPAAARIAAAIVKQRDLRPFTDTLELAQLVERVVPRRGPRHPATKIFQALRIQVNDEFGALHEVLEVAAQRLKPGGRLGIITFHSLEDRIVKHFCRETSTPSIDRPEWPAPRANPRWMFRSVTRRAIQPSAAEIARNPRARSAKLRALERNASPFSSRPQTQIFNHGRSQAES